MSLTSSGARRAASSSLVFGLAVLAASPARAQVKPSQTGGVSQHVAETVVTLGYDRPVARGRELFGPSGIVDYDVVWTPGANRATWIDFSTPVTLEGHALDAGRYGVWTVPHGDEPWEVILVSEWDTHHSFFPFETEVARFRVTPEPADHMETLAFYFPVVEGYEATLAFHWGTVRLPMRLRAAGG